MLNRVVMFVARVEICDIFREIDGDDGTAGWAFGVSYGICREFYRFYESARRMYIYLPTGRGGGVGWGIN